MPAKKDAKGNHQGKQSDEEGLMAMAEQLPKPPAMAALSPPELSSLAKLGDDETERAQVALDELVKKGPALQQQLGADLPDQGGVRQIRDELNATEQGFQRAQELMAYWHQQNLLARHAAVSLLQDVHGELRHRAGKHPELLAGYETTERFFTKRSEAILEGRRLAREAKKNSPKS